MYILHLIWYIFFQMEYMYKILTYYIYASRQRQRDRDKGRQRSCLTILKSCSECLRVKQTGHFPQL